MNKIIMAGVGILVLGYFIKRGMKEKSIEMVMEKQSIQDVISRYSDDCDQLILREIQNNKDLTYISGYFIVKLSEDLRKVQLKAEMYFQDQSGQWIKKESQDSIKTISLHAEDFEELKTKTELKYELSSPELPQLTAN